MELATVVALKEDAVALITSNHHNVDTRCWCTCWLAQVIWCIGGTQGDAHSIASSVLAVAVVTVRLRMRCAMMCRLPPAVDDQGMHRNKISVGFCFTFAASFDASPTLSRFMYMYTHPSD